MSSLLDRKRLAALEHDNRPVLSRKLPFVKTAMSLTDPASCIDPNEPGITSSHQHPCLTATEDKRVWRTGQDAMTYNAWLAKEKELDEAFRIWQKTKDGKREIEVVYTRFPGLRLTSMRVEDVPWFLREMSTPDTHLRKSWDAAFRDEDTEPGFSAAQMTLLLLLTSPLRSLSISSISDLSKELFPLYQERSTNSLYVQFFCNGIGQANGYDCLFPHRGYLEGNIPGWPLRSESAASDPNSLTLPPGEESMLMSDRYRDQPLYRDTPPYLSASSIYPGKTTKGIADLPGELLNEIIKRVGLFEGPVLMALSKSRNENSPRHFRYRFMLPSHRAVIGGYAGAGWNEAIAPYKRMPKILHLRKVCRVWNEMVRDVFFQNTFVFRYGNHVNGSRAQNVWSISTSMREDRYKLADFNIRFIPIMGSGVAQPFSASGGIAFQYAEEVVHLGASCNAGRMVFGTDAPCDRSFVRKWISNQLFLDSGGHLAVRAFRLEFDPGPHALELSRLWLSDIFQCLYHRGIGDKQAGGETLLLDWSDRDQ
jgi:hypothetical protein